MSDIMIGNSRLGRGEPVCIVFEAGPTHDGLETAKALVDMAADAGADAIKFQILDTDALVPDRSVQFTYKWLADREAGRVETISESLWEILKRRELGFDEWAVLIEYCRERGVAFFSTATYEHELKFLHEHGVNTVKICSGDITHHEFLRSAAKYDWSVQIDTGGATLAEVEQAVDVLEQAGCRKVIINHCPSGYPARLESINLRVLTTLGQMYPRYPVAFSDHTPGWRMDVAAVALGANMVEKTVTLDRGIRSPEHIMSLEPSEAREFVQVVRDLEIALGQPRRIVTDKERAVQIVGRRSLFAAKDMAKGDVLTQECLAYARPGDGIPANLDGLVLNRRVNHDLKCGDKLNLADFS